jgi:uncharacterized membrane protein YebE (DUF533 family)
MKRIMVINNPLTQTNPAGGYDAAYSDYAKSGVSPYAQIAGLSELNLLKEGCFAVLNSDGTLVDMEVTTPVQPTGDYAILAVKTKSGQVRTVHIHKGKVKATAQAYAAGSVRNVTLGYFASTNTGKTLGVNAATVANGDEFILKITKPALPYEDAINNYKLYSVVVSPLTTALATTQAGNKMEGMLRAMAAKITADGWLDAAITVSIKASTYDDGGLKFIGNAAGEQFIITPLDGLRAANVTENVAGAAPVGISSLIKAEEINSLQEEGYDDRFGGPLNPGAPVTDTVDGVNYNVINVDYYRNPSAVPSVKSFTDKQTLLLAFADIAAVTTTDHVAAADGLYTKMLAYLNLYV